MLKTNDREWISFLIKDLFITEKFKNKLQVPTGALMSKKELNTGNEPRITVTSQNNGIYDFYKTDNKMRKQKNFISVSFLGTIFYHQYEASLDMKVHCLILKDRQMNKYLSLFLISEIKKSIENSSYGNQLSSTDLPMKKIMLPVDENGNPDYDFMEQFIKEREEIKKQKYITYINKKIKILDTATPPPENN